MYSRILRNGSIVTLVLITTLTAGAIVGVLFKMSRSSTHVEALTVPASDRRVQVVRFTLYDRGIYPQEARANPGHITISIEDLTGSSDGLTIDRVDANGRASLGAVNKPARALRTRKDVHLPAGNYELVDANRTANRALLIVGPDEF